MQWHVVSGDVLSGSQVPRASVWFEAANRVYKFFVAAPDKDTKAKQVRLCELNSVFVF